MRLKISNIISAIITVFFLLLFGAQVLAMFIASNPPKTLGMLLHGDGETVVILLFIILLGLLVLLIAFFLAFLQCVAAWLKRVIGLVLCAIGVCMDAIYIFFVTVAMGIFAGADGLIALGAVCFFFGAGLMCILSLFNLFYILVEMVVSKYKSLPA